MIFGGNGSGKSTVLGLLSGEVQPTSGSVFIAGHNAGSLEGITAAWRKVGFCPQSNPLLEGMTGRETLHMFARLRGVPKGWVATHVDSILELLTLYSCAEEPIEQYSGGNKRKLVLGIALVGDPDVLLIDESCSGVDPTSQRRIWDLIARITKDRTVLLTTHSMDEAQALSSRTAIMADGKLLCLGSVQHLKVSKNLSRWDFLFNAFALTATICWKSKYRDGYTIDIFLFGGASTDQVDLAVQEVLGRTLPGSRLVERYWRFLRFEVPHRTRSRLGPMFRSLEDLKNSKRFGGVYTGRRLVEGYSIRQWLVHLEMRNCLNLSCTVLTTPAIGIRLTIVIWSRYSLSS